MANPKYMMIGEPEDKVIEECSEVIKAICKARRFGWANYHPDDPTKTTNIELVKREIIDACFAFKELKAKLKTWVWEQEI